MNDAGTRLLFKFRSGTHEELGRHRGREGKKECALCGHECESVCHCSYSEPNKCIPHLYIPLRGKRGGHVMYCGHNSTDLLQNVQEGLGDSFSRFETKPRN